MAGPRVFSSRSGGVLLPVASLPGPHGVGDLGSGALRFLDWCAEAGFGWWQFLPVGPLGSGDSPYAARSAFAGEALYLSLELMRDAGWLEARDLRCPKRMASGPVDYAAARSFKLPRLALAAERWRRAGGMRRAGWRGFRARSEAWLDGWLAPLEGAARDVEAFVQFQFDLQWKALRREARRRKIRLLGDLPIFVGLDSADVAQHPELFRLDAKGRPKVVSGAPPDGYSADGQLWGHPHYRWATHRRDGFDWWRRRFAQELERCDALRIDHFIGFHHAWEVPGGERTARNGRWGRTPGARILELVAADHGSLPLVAEDLGAVTAPVHALRDRFGIPGMRVLQFAFGEGGYDRPHAHPENSVVYTGTHDNDTTVGWWTKLAKPERDRVRAYLGLPSRGMTAQQVTQALVAALFASPASTAVVPLQDLLGTGSATRINRPGTANGNWTWRVDAGALSANLAARSRAALDVTERTRSRAPRA